MKQLEKRFANLVPEEKTPSEDRLVMLCDGVFAIAITLLVLDIGTKVSGSNIDNSLYTLIQPTISYLFTFLILTIYWRFHRNLMLVVQRLDRGFISLTFLFLAFIAFFPVPSKLLGNYGEHATVVVIYTLTLSGCGFSAFALWFYATWKHRLVSPDLPQAEINARTRWLLFTPLIYCASLLLLFVVPQDRPYFICFSWALIGFAERIVKNIYKRWLEKPVQELIHRQPKDQNQPAADPSAIRSESAPIASEPAEKQGI
jgi:uncharacterized membrane protein